MNAYRPHRDEEPRETPAEELLREAGLDGRADADALAALLAAVTAPGSEEELSGERAALAAFRAAAHDRRRPRSPARTPRATILGTAAAALIALALAAGGGGFPAGTGAASPRPASPSPSAPATPFDAPLRAATPPPPAPSGSVPAPPATDRPLVAPDGGVRTAPASDLRADCDRYLADPAALTPVELDRLTLAARTARDPETPLTGEDLTAYCRSLLAALP